MKHPGNSPQTLTPLGLSYARIPGTYHLDGYGWITPRPTFPEGWTEEDVAKAAEHVLRTAWSDGVFGDVTATFRGVSVIVHVKRRKSGYRVASIFPEA